MMSPDELCVVRRAFARQIVHKAGSGDRRLEKAFGEIPRETFLGSAPWRIGLRSEGHQQTAGDDPVLVYQDMPVAILADKGLNNGQPSFLAMLIDLCAVREGHHVVHIGTGTGYYTAVLGRLAGATGRVLGLEYEAELAERATRNLEAHSNIEIICGDGWTQRLEPADAILVNAGTPRLAPTWLDALRPGGRLVVPLATQVEDNGRNMTRGAVFRITRDDMGYAASCELGTMIYPCLGASDLASEAALAAAFETKTAKQVKRLRRGEVVDDSRCWLRGEGWAFTFD